MLWVALWWFMLVWMIWVLGVMMVPWRRGMRVVVLPVASLVSLLPSKAEGFHCLGFESERESGRERERERERGVGVSEG